MCAGIHSDKLQVYWGYSDFKISLPCVQGSGTFSSRGAPGQASRQVIGFRVQGLGSNVEGPGFRV